MGIQERTWKNETCHAEVLMYEQDVVEEKLTNLAFMNTKQYKADPMTKFHTSEAHETLCDDRIETRLKQNQEVEEQCEDETKRRNARSQSAVMKKNENTKTSEEV